MLAKMYYNKSGEIISGLQSVDENHFLNRLLTFNVMFLECSLTNPKYLFMKKIKNMLILFKNINIINIIKT